MKGKRDHARDFPGKRWLVNLLRAAHLVGVVGIGAGVLGEVAESRWFGFGLATLVSGLLILSLDSWTRPSYFRELAGLAVAGKLLLVGALLAWPAQRNGLFWLILVFSVLFAHAPASLRHAVWLKRN
ncbi:MAG: hypothetical protein LC123_04650 [Burkholderiales bacterium]|jgi:hypothetical protein|uniref:Uncharacterized protein n=1 Tax=Candidatus Desulfobacillus denitrificans TaxID=2608985 RepID=A0A809S2I4_9PROT|nr:hypothetical protein [Zoogloeaceae bacterium]MCC7269671.1 hypothetical protein [Rhodocyclaceae bacterium]MCZ2173867.1 hypothetical protein [Burkholderiales bacterium]OQY71270.1 MAG: hypothetical protein B6D47_06640 [Rhodocyclaceae bacterium UTPRO2]BBO19761.1 conserved hypothetical protein [Candidatus Desulfobacillus denitrificans]GIK45908.1 MAG: hypothetical protein BroJett012_18110 [Betaproteobacteria bacterium]